MLFTEFNDLEGTRWAQIAENDPARIVLIYGQPLYEENDAYHKKWFVEIDEMLGIDHPEWFTPEQAAELGQLLLVLSHEAERRNAELV